MLDYSRQQGHNQDLALPSAILTLKPMHDPPGVPDFATIVHGGNKARIHTACLVDWHELIGVLVVSARALCIRVHFEAHDQCQDASLIGSTGPR